MTHGATIAQPAEGDTVNLIEETPQEVAQRRYQHALKADKQRARCCRFFCFFGVFFGLIFLLAVPLSWWQAFVCTPSPSVFEGSVLGIELRGQGQSFVNLWPESERIYYGKADDAIPVASEQQYNGVGTYDETRNLFFWAVPKCLKCKSSRSPHGIYIYARDGSKSDQVIEIGEMQIQALAIDSFDPKTLSWRLYAVLENGEVMSYDEHSGWSPFTKIEDEFQQIMWNFAVVNTKERVLYFGAIKANGEATLYQYSLALKKGKTSVVKYPVDPNLRHSKFDPRNNTFVWMQVVNEESATISIRRFSPGQEERLQQFNHVHEEVATALIYEHKLTFDPINSRFYLLNPYALKIFVIEFSNISVLSVNSYRTRSSSPLYLHYVAPMQV